MRKLFLLSLLAVNSIALFGQATGRMTGVITDQTGAKMPGAKVNLYLAGGQTPILNATTSSEGVFDFPALRADTYDLAVEASGFARYTQARIKVDPAKETAVPTIAMQLAASSQTVDITEAVTAVQTTTYEVATTVTQSQVENLPVLDRQIANLFSTQAGVGSNGYDATVMNGLRPSYTAVTLDGVNIQDNWVRLNTMDFLPNRLTIAQVAEMTVSSANTNAAIGGGANQITMVTPSGSNGYHGSLYWFNRNSHFGANDWFNNQNDIERPFLNLNQLGGGIGGPIKKDKLLFYGNYEAYRRKNQVPVLNQVLTPSARQGILTYRDAQGALRQFNVLSASGLSIDPTIQSMLQQLPAAGNTSQLGDGLNTAGYSFNARSNITRDIVTGKLDYYLTERHSFAGTYVWNRDVVDRPFLGAFYTPVPPVSNDNSAALFSTAWRWTVSPSMTNEVRGGFNRTKGPFSVSNETPSLLLSSVDLLFTSPINTKLPEGRDTATYMLQDNANWIKGKHSLSFGYNAQFVRVPVYDYVSTVATYQLGIGPTSPYGFALGDIPGLRANDLVTANRLLANLAGLVVSGTKSFNPTSATSGFVPGAPLSQNWSQDNHAFYLSDSWRIRPRLTLVLGLRWDYWTVADERDSLQLQPIVQNGNAPATLLTNATLDLHGNSVGRPLYKRDLNNFAPNLGFAWDIFGNGKTALRGGYSIAYANDNTGNSIINTTGANAGLQGTTAFQNAAATLRNPPPLNPPPFQIPLTVRDNYISTGGNNIIGLIDPNLKTPYVQQWSLGLQHEIKGIVVEARYVANHTVGLLRTIDMNQINPQQAGFVEDVTRARSNGFLAQAAGQGFNPAYNPAIPGSQPLPVISTFGGGGVLTNATIRGQIQRGEVGTLAQTYATSGLTPAGVNFFPNPLALYAAYLTNVSHSSYNSFQIEARRSFRNGIQFQANYVFGKVLSDATALRALDPALDNRNAGLERSRAPFDITQAFKLNHVIPVPFGKGHRLSYHPLDRFIGGWYLSGFLTVQTGQPVSILSARGTLNRGARSGNNTVDTNLTRDQLRDVVGFFMTGDGPYFINPSAIGPDGRGVAADGAAPFQGQVFFNPAPGGLGSLQRRSFNGPRFAGYDFALMKEVALTERHRLQVRAEFFNLTNTPSFLLGGTSGDLAAVQNVNNPAFGRVTSTASIPRQVQFSLFYRF